MQCSQETPHLDTLGNQVQELCKVWFWQAHHRLGQNQCDDVDFCALRHKVVVAQEC